MNIFREQTKQIQIQTKKTNIKQGLILRRGHKKTQTHEVVIKITNKRKDNYLHIKLFIKV